MFHNLRINDVYHYIYCCVETRTTNVLYLASCEKIRVRFAVQFPDPSELEDAVCVSVVH
jgi:hypothetical protein